MQQFLTNLLPGVRELRAPLAAGYLWLTFTWLLVADDLPTQAEATGPLAALYELLAVLGPVSSAIAVSFAAYLLGAISETITGFTLRTARRIAIWLRENYWLVKETFGRKVIRSIDWGVTGLYSFDELKTASKYDVPLSSESIRKARDLVRRSLRRAFKQLNAAGLTPIDLIQDEYRGVPQSISFHVWRGNQWLMDYITSPDPSVILENQVVDHVFSGDYGAGDPLALPGESERSATKQFEEAMSEIRDVIRESLRVAKGDVDPSKFDRAEFDAAFRLGQGDDLRATIEGQSRVVEVLRRQAPALVRFIPNVNTLSWAHLENNVLVRLLEQLHLVEARLITKNAELYGRFDRLKAESELRLAVAPPLMALGILLAIVVNWLFGLGILGVALLARSGWKRGREASDTLVDSMIAADVEPPVLQELREFVEARKPAADKKPPEPVVLPAPP